MNTVEVTRLLTSTFAQRHVTAAIGHYSEALDKFIREDWEGVSLKAGKFVEAVTKCLVVYCGLPLSLSTRTFKAGNELRKLEQVSASLPETVRVVVPKACLTIYEITNNRGGRHDPGDIDANEMDAKVIIPLMMWILAELVRFSTVGGDIKAAQAAIEEITNKLHPAFEVVDGRVYVNLSGLTAREVGLLLLYEAYPTRLDRKTLVEAITRHGHAHAASRMAVGRMADVLDEHDGSLKLRAPGREQAERILSQHT